MLIQKAKGQPPHQATFDKNSGNASLEQASGLVSGGPGGPWPPQNFRIY